MVTSDFTLIWFWFFIFFLARFWFWHNYFLCSCRRACAFHPWFAFRPWFAFHPFFPLCPSIYSIHLLSRWVRLRSDKHYSFLFFFYSLFIFILITVYFRISCQMYCLNVVFKGEKNACILLHIFYIALNCIEQHEYTTCFSHVKLSNWEKVFHESVN